VANYVLSPDAARSIAEIDTYTAKKFGSEQAVLYLKSLLARFEFIAEDLHRGRHRPELNADYFRYFVGSHTIYYRIISEQVQIIDV
jgi:toxin ParE1/3/4